MMTACAAIAAICATAALAAQPFSKSMAECAGLNAFGRDYIRDDDLAHLLEYGQARWINAAIIAAQNEGVSNPVVYVEDAMNAKYDEWKGKGIMAVFSEDFGDWHDYCRAFARHNGINLDPP